MSSQPAHILVLEDHPTHRKVLVFNLRSAGFRVTTAADVTKALILAYHEHFDLIIADYHLPDATGADFIKRLRDTDTYVGTPIILLTARANELNGK